jgi:hypothetical protein
MQERNIEKEEYQPYIDKFKEQKINENKKESLNFKKASQLFTPSGQAKEFENVVRSSAKSSPILTPDESIEIMASLDEIRRQIGLIYPSEK